uniref:UPF0193 protein EVG1 n=1 Tax=Lonchura striata TaxID=40157 RepID=UPI001293772F|nr:UPF0193 protein EVG1 [Lonchura striata domestica]
MFPAGRSGPALPGAASGRCRDATGSHRGPLPWRPPPLPRAARAPPVAMEAAGCPGRGGLSAAGRPARYSTGTRELVKGMMEELQMTHSQKRYLMAYVKRGDALPLQRFSPSSKQPVTVSSPAACQPHRLPARPLLRPAGVCQAGDAYTREKFKPQPTRDLEKEKRRLQNILASGKDDVEEKVEQVFIQKKEEEIPEADRFEECTLSCPQERGRKPGKPAPS